MTFELGPSGSLRLGAEKPSGKQSVGWPFSAWKRCAESGFACLVPIHPAISARRCGRVTPVRLRRARLSVRVPRAKPAASRRASCADWRASASAATLDEARRLRSGAGLGVRAEAGSVLLHRALRVRSRSFGVGFCNDLEAVRHGQRKPAIERQRSRPSLRSWSSNGARPCDVAALDHHVLDY